MLFTNNMILHNLNISVGIIGKKHVGPDTVYKFDYEQTEENHSILQIGRNITLMKEKVREFLSMAKQNSKYVNFNDNHFVEKNIKRWTNLVS